MAISRYKDVTIKFGAVNDEITDTVYVQAITLEHSAAANAVLSSGGVAVAEIRIAANDLFDELVFPKPIRFAGLKATTLSAGNLRIFLA